MQQGMYTPKGMCTYINVFFPIFLERKYFVFASLYIYLLSVHVCLCVWVLVKPGVTSDVAFIPRGPSPCSLQQGLSLKLELA